MRTHFLVLREEHRQRTDSYTTYLAHGGKGDPAKEVGLDALAIAISALEKTKWISVKDRLPEKSGYYLVFADIGRREVLSYSKKYQAFNAFDDVYSEEYVIPVSHWMPIPNPPKGE